MKYTSITCPQCGFDQSVSVPDHGTRALHKCDNCKVVVGVPDGSTHQCIICAYGNEDCPGRALGHTNHQRIRWNKVTWYSKVIAVLLFVVVYVIGFWLGTEYQSTADDLVSLQESRQQIAQEVGKRQASRVLGVTDDNRLAVQWIDTKKSNPYFEECDGVAVAVYGESTDNKSLETVLKYQLGEAKSLDRLTGYTNPLGKTGMSLAGIEQVENGPLRIALTGNIGDLQFCEQIQVVTQLQATLASMPQAVDTEVVLNGATLFVVPTTSENQAVAE